MNKQPFIHLHHHSTYSVQDGIGYPDEIIENCLSKGFDTIAITDHGTMDCTADYYLTVKRHYPEFKPIFGCEFYMVRDLKETTAKLAHLEETREEYSSQEYKEARRGIIRLYHLTLLAKNFNGLQNLYQLVFEGFKNFYYKPRIDMNLLMKYSKDVICLSGCTGGFLNNHIRDQKVTDKFMETFKKDLYLEIQFNELDIQRELNKDILWAHKNYGLPLVYTNDGHYLNKEDNIVQDTLLLIQQKKTIKDENKWQFTTRHLYIKQANDVRQFNKEFNYKIQKKMFDDMLGTSLDINAKIDKFDFDESIKILTFKNNNKILIDAANKGLRKKKLNTKKEYKQRLDFELDIIKKKNISDYFILISDITDNMSKKMIIGPGRGSAAGSLVSYVLGITNVDPIKHKLFFERFISIDRPEMPDIDIDFQYPDQAKQFLRDKYGEENVAVISTLGTFQPKNLIKDICRVFDLIDFHEVNTFTKQIEKEIKNYIQEAEINKGLIYFDYQLCYDQLPTFRNFIDTYKDKHPEIIHSLTVLLNQVRYLGKHAAGVVVCENLKEKMPLKIQKNEIVCPFVEGATKRTLNDLGFIKIDILGLNTLSIVDYILKKNKLTVDIFDTIDLNDKKVYKFIYEDLNLFGIFQFETSLMKRLIKDVKPTQFNDLSALNSIGRPGPLKAGITAQFGLRKNGIEPEVYVDPKVKPILQESYGLIIYQEQIMEIVKKLAGFTNLETEVLRKILFKKSKEAEKENAIKIKKLKTKFITGCIQNGMEKKKVEKLWDEMAVFGSYAFNKAHSVSYAMLAYWTSYLKTYYTIDFYVALLNIKDAEHYNIIIAEAKQNGVKFRQLNINEMDADFKNIKSEIVFGLRHIKNVGDKAVDEIMKAKNKTKFVSLTEFLCSPKISWTKVNKRVMTSLILVGCFDAISQVNRKQLLEFYSLFLEKKNKIGVNKMDKETIIAKVGAQVLETITDNYTDTEMKEFEDEYLNCNFRYDVWNGPKLKRAIPKLNPFDESRSGRDLMLVTRIKEHVAKNGLMAFIDGVDRFGIERNVVVFADKWTKGMIKVNKVYLVKYYKKDDSPFMLYGSFIDFDKVKI